MALWDRPFAATHIALCVSIAALTIVSLSPDTRADDGNVTLDNRSFQERQHERADNLRRRSKAAARMHLGYPYYGGDSDRPGPDYSALSHQISRLAAMLRRMAEEDAARSVAPQGGYIPAGPPVGRDGLPGVPGQVAVKGLDIYGPAGPSERSVRLLLDYKLLLVGNPRLQVGDIKDEGETILASVVTTDGSLVEQYRVNKSTGVWVPIR